MLNIGDKITRVPTWAKLAGAPKDITTPQTGTVIYINRRNHYCVLEYNSGLREGLKIVNPAQFASLVKIPEGKHFDAGGYR